MTLMADNRVRTIGDVERKLGVYRDVLRPTLRELVKDRMLRSEELHHEMIYQANVKRDVRR